MPKCPLNISSSVQCSPFSLGNEVTLLRRCQLEVIPGKLQQDPRRALLLCALLHFSEPLFQPHELGALSCPSPPSPHSWAGKERSCAFTQHSPGSFSEQPLGAVTPHQSILPPSISTISLMLWGNLNPKEVKKKTLLLHFVFWRAESEVLLSSKAERVLPSF